MKTALIVGAGGDIAQALIERIRNDYEVFALSRSAGTTADHWYQTDYSDDDLKAIADRIDTRFDLVIVCNGVLHDDTIMPEKSLRQLDAEALQYSFYRNTIVPALVLKYFGRHLRQRQRTVCALLSARVGSIEDNRTGGWYGYRCSKAALNMLVRNASIELAWRNKQSIVIALHPGTTLSRLSHRFLSARTPAVDASITAARLIDVLDNLEPSDNGTFKNWDGESLPW